MVVVEVVFHYCWFVWLSKLYVLVVLLCSGLYRSTRLSDVHLATLIGYALLQLRSRRFDQDASKACPLTPHFILLVAWRPEVSKGALWLNVVACESWWRRTLLGKTLCSATTASALAIHSITADMRPLCVASGEYRISGKCCAPKQQVTFCSSGGNHTANYRSCVKWKDTKAALAKHVPVDRSKGSSTPSPSCHAGWIKWDPPQSMRACDLVGTTSLRGSHVKTTPLTDPYPSSGLVRVKWPAPGILTRLQNLCRVSWKPLYRPWLLSLSD